MDILEQLATIQYPNPGDYSNAEVEQFHDDLQARRKARLKIVKAHTGYTKAILRNLAIALEQALINDGFVYSHRTGDRKLGRVLTESQLWDLVSLKLLAFVDQRITVADLAFKMPPSYRFKLTKKAESLREIVGFHAWYL